MGQERVLARPGWEGENMRAVKGSLGHSSEEKYKELEDFHWTRAVGDQSAPIPEEIPRKAYSHIL